MKEEMLKAIYDICESWLEYALHDEAIDKSELYESEMYRQAYTFITAYRREVLHEKQ